MKLYFLGSSVTYGAASGGLSMADVLARRRGIAVEKNAVNGTTLADLDENSYLSRLVRARAERPDVFVCQLSTNDARLAPLGEPSAADACGDPKTTCGALERISDLVKARWGCPFLLYSSAYFYSPAYAREVELAAVVAARRGMRFLDLYRDAAFNDLPPALRARYMHDEIHPTAEGYEKWWTPAFEEALGL